MQRSVFEDLLVVRNFTDAVEFNVFYTGVNKLAIHYLVSFVLVIEFIARVKSAYFVGCIYVENYNASIEIQLTLLWLRE